MPIYSGLLLVAAALHEYTHRNRMLDDYTTVLVITLIFALSVAFQDTAQPREGRVVRSLSQNDARRRDTRGLLAKLRLITGLLGLSSTPLSGTAMRGTMASVQTTTWLK